MGIINSKNPLVVDNFDGQSGDHDLGPEDIDPVLGPEWFVGEENLRILSKELQNLDTAPVDVKPFSFDGAITVGKCVKVYDGDTVHFVVRYNDQWIRRRFRMIGYNSPEIRGTGPKEKEKAIAARDYLAERLLNKKAVLYLHDFDKWGRVLCDVYLIEDEKCITLDNLFAHHLNKEMIRKGHGVPYYGKGSKVGATPQV